MHAPECLAAVAKRVDVRIDALLSSEVAQWAAVDGDLVEPLEALRALVLAGGKRLRPAFCHWAFVAAGGDPDDDAVIDAGAALELLHTFALIHDDVMDASACRRGLATVHEVFHARHLDGAWRAEGRRFGESVAILLGDLAFVYADLLMAGAPRAAVEVFTELRLEVNLGQYLDLVAAVRGDAAVEKARRIGRYKSGKYTVERPLHLGAALAGRLDDLRRPLSAYGDPLGEAFQLRDDLLGAFGVPSVTGKPVGGDLRRGKLTQLYAFAAGSGDDDAVRALHQRYGDPQLSEAEVAVVQDVLVRTGARRRVEVAMASLVGEALAALDAASLAPPAKEHLAELARFVAGRDH